MLNTKINTAQIGARLEKDMDEGGGSIEMRPERCDREVIEFPVVSDCNSVDHVSVCDDPRWSRSQTLEYVAEIAEELAGISGKVGCKSVSTLLKSAVLEARSQLRKK